MATSIAKQLGLSTTKVQAALQSVMPAPGQGAAGGSGSSSSATTS
jgi:hypothetical protein